MKSPADKHTESKGKGKNAEDGATKAKSRAEQRAELREKIESKACVDCKAVCVEVPAAGTSGSRKHVILKDEDIDLWVDLAVQARATTTNPPPALLLKLSDKASRSQKQKEAGPSNPHTPPNIAGRHSPDHHPTFSTYPNPHHYPFGSPAQHALPPYSGFPYGMAPLAPPFAGPGFSFPYPPAYPSFYPPMPTSSNPYAATPSVTNSPWLADWLPSLDVGERGRHGDNFGALVPGFAAARIFRVSQLRNHTEEELQRITFYTKTGSEYHLTPPTTARLMEFVHADAPLVDPPY
ncbi:hypothetical protein FRC12_010314 [Ceratobasidium sp. 428]|nr:hypothetical protein FRC12_010314 [Ceratobasidium sp. 428]